MSIKNAAPGGPVNNPQQDNTGSQTKSYQQLHDSNAKAELLSQRYIDGQEYQFLSVHDGSVVTRSLINRYAFYSYRGLDGENNPTRYFNQDIYNNSTPQRETLIEDKQNGAGITNTQKENGWERTQKKQLHKKVVTGKTGREYMDKAKNPTASEIINQFNELSDKTGSVQYDWADFLYCKYYGEIPNNHMITIRRFGTPIIDNIYNDELLNGKRDLARAITWFGEETENSLSDILGLSFGLNWSEMESDVQVLHSQRMGFGLVSTLLGRDVQKDENMRGILSGRTNGWHRNDKAWKGETDIMDTYPNFVYGPVNVIDKMMRRDRGLFFEHEFDVKCTYSLKSYGDINPKVAMLDVMSQIFTIGYNNAPFWGGARRYKSDPRREHLLGDEKKLMNGDYGGYLSSVGQDIMGSVSNLFNDGKEGFGFGDIMKGFERIGGGIVQNMFGNALQKSGVRPAYQVIHALLTGEPTGDWHITIGNPFNPIAVMGNMICTKTSINLSDNLGADDFPDTVTATFTFKHAKPRDKSDLESMFNAGKGRMYHMAQGFDDRLNQINRECHYGQIDPKDCRKGKVKKGKKGNPYHDAEKATKSMNALTGGRAGRVSESSSKSIEKHVLPWIKGI